MKVGTKSLLFGVHQFIWHPITVYMAWLKLYGKPNLKEIVCIIIHDWGYWGSPNIDGAKGKKHPEWAALQACKWFGQDYFYLCLYHSRHYAENHTVLPSKLCWADKLSIIYEPWWFYIPRAILSGEIYEYRLNRLSGDLISTYKSHREWFSCLKKWLSKQAIEQKSNICL